MYYLFFFLIPAFLIEGSGLNINHNYLFIYYLLVPAFLWFRIVFINRNIYISPILALIISLIILVQFTSFFLSIDKEQSFEKIMFYFTLLSIFLYSKSFSRNVDRLKLIKLLLCLICSFLFISYLVPFIRDSIFSSFFSFRETQVIVATNESHNHLGDLLGLGMICTFFLYINEYRLRYLLLNIFIIPFYILSFSRSSYIALMGTILIYGLFVTPTFKKMLCVIFIGWFLTLLIILVSQKTPFNDFFLINKMQSMLVKNASLYPRKLAESRYNYFIDALNAIKERPFFGYGIGNFSYASQKYETQYYSGTSHNIILDNLVESGVLGVSIFLIGIIYVFYHLFKNKSFFFFFTIYLFFNFQTDYTFTIYLFLMLFTLGSSIGLSYQKYEMKIPPYVTSILSIIPLLFVICFLSSMIFLQKRSYKLAYIIYPLNKAVLYQEIIDPKTSDTDKYLAFQRYRFIAPYDLDFLIPQALFYEKKEKWNEATTSFKTAYMANRYVNFIVIQHIYRLTEKIESTKAANYFLAKVFMDYENIPKSKMLINTINEFCNTLPKKTCQKLRWWGK